MLIQSISLEMSTHLFRGTVVIRQLRPEFKFPAKIEMAFIQILAIR